MAAAFLNQDSPLKSSLIGKSERRKEDPVLISGRGTYSDDVKYPQQLYLSIVRSPYAHASIDKVDLSKAKHSEGIVLALDGQQIRDKVDPLPIMFSFYGTQLPKYPCLAMDKVRFVGEPVALVVGSARSLVEDARDEIEIDFSPLVPVVRAEELLE